MFEWRIELIIEYVVHAKTCVVIPVIRFGEELTDARVQSVVVPAPVDSTHQGDLSPAADETITCHAFERYRSRDRIVVRHCVVD